ncbi:hypothetical protein [Treponema socranskii]
MIAIKNPPSPRPITVLKTPAFGRKKVPGKINEPQPMIEPITRLRTLNFDKPFFAFFVFIVKPVEAVSIKKGCLL